jgi:hypothetical protein
MEQTTSAGPRAAVQLAALAAALGAVLHVLKGVLLIADVTDLGVVPLMGLLFSAGLLGYGRVLARTALVRTAAGVAAFALLCSAAGCAYRLWGWAPELTGAPAGVTVAYVGLTFGIFVSLLLFGVAAARTPDWRAPWRYVPLVAAVAWFPLEGLTAVLPDGWGLVGAGLGWLAAAAALAVAGREGWSDGRRRLVS